MEKEKKYLNTNNNNPPITNEEADLLIEENTRLIEELVILKNTRVLHNTNSKIVGYKGYGTLLNENNIFSETQYFDLLKMIQILKQYFLNKYDYQNSSYEFIVRKETLLFEDGTCAVFKAPDGEFYPVRYTYDVKDLGFYSIPKKIKIITDNDFNEKEITKDFVILYNNSMRVNTLYGLYDRINGYLRSLVDIDNVGYISRPKWFIGNIEGPTQAVELEAAYASNQVFISGLNFKVEAFELNNTDKNKTYQEIFMFNMNLILKFLGISTEDLINKNAQQNNEEIERQANYEGEVQADFLKARIENVKKMNSIGYMVTLNETQEDEVKDSMDIAEAQELIPESSKKSLMSKMKDKLKGKKDE